MNDFGSFLVCAPAYFLLFYPRAISRFVEPYVSRVEPLQVKEEPSQETEELIEESIEERLQKQSIDEILEGLNKQERARTKNEEALFHSMHETYRELYKTPMDGAGWALFACSLTYLGFILRKRAMGRR